MTLEIVRARSRTPRKGIGAPRAVGPVALLLLWWVATAAGWADPSILPSPLTLGRTLVTLWTQDDLLGHLGVSLTRSIVGGAIGVTTGLVLGTVSGLWQRGEELIDASMQMLRTIPILALIPLLIVWMGIGETPKLFMIALATSFPMYLNSYAGIRNVDRKLVEAMRAFGLRGHRLILQVLLPLSLPSIFTGLRYSASVSVLILVAAEQVNASRGIGYLINTAQTYQQVDVIMICILVYAAFGLLADALVRLAERVFAPWRTSVAIR
ncbi:MAG: ABC transporter permease [Sphingomonas sp.]